MIMKLILSMMLIMITTIMFFLTACAPKVITLDDARQIAVNMVMTDDNYVQNDGYDFKELEAKSLDCAGCFAFKYEYSINPDYIPGVNGYIVDVTMRTDDVTSVIFGEQSQQNDVSARNDMIDSLPPIVDRFDEFCENKCGNGYCDEIVCQDIDCVCEETPQNCPEDC